MIARKKVKCSNATLDLSIMLFSFGRFDFEIKFFSSFILSL